MAQARPSGSFLWIAVEPSWRGRGGERIPSVAGAQPKSPTSRHAFAALPRSVGERDPVTRRARRDLSELAEWSRNEAGGDKGFQRGCVLHERWSAGMTAESDVLRHNAKCPETSGAQGHSPIVSQTQWVRTPHLAQSFTDFPRFFGARGLTFLRPPNRCEGAKDETLTGSISIRY